MEAEDWIKNDTHDNNIYIRTAAHQCSNDDDDNNKISITIILPFISLVISKLLLSTFTHIG